MSLLWTQASQHRTESVEHILQNCQPSTGTSWRETHDQTDWDHPTPKAFVDNVKRNGMQQPIGIHWDTSPPTVKDHARLLSAYRAGLKHVPVKDYHDPDDWLYTASLADD